VELLPEPAYPVMRIRAGHCRAVRGGCVIFWRVVLKITLMVAAIVMIALLLSGTIMMLQNIQHAG
jgi:hypothetical protein